MTDPKGNSQFCFPRVSRGNKTRCFFRLVILKLKVFCYNPNSKIEKKKPFA